jgi:hypothetical protein
VLLGVCVEGGEEVVRDGRLRGIECVAPVLELGHRQQAVRRARVAEREDDLALVDLPVGPCEVKVLRVERLAVFVHAAQREVERVARVAEVVRLAAEVAQAELRRENGVRQVDLVG